MGDGIWCFLFDGAGCSWFVKIATWHFIDSTIVMKCKRHSCGPSTFHIFIAFLKRGMGVFIKCKGICAQHIERMNSLGTYCVA